MKVAVTSAGEGLDAEVDPRFGRCNQFVVVDVDEMTAESFPNKSALATGGAGIQAAQTVAELGVDVVLTGTVGPNAFQTLSVAGVRVMTGARGTIGNAVKMFNNGELTETSAPNVASHAGMGRGLGQGRGGR